MSKTVLAVAGLSEMRKGFKGIDKDLPKGIRILLNTVAQVVVDAAKPKVASKTGAARGSLKAASSQTQAKVSAGGRAAPYYPWLDFGGSTGRKKATKRPFYKSGRYIFPTVAEKQDDIQKAMLKAVQQLAAASGVEVS
ncbi:MAG: hypothetical protein ACJ72N_27440 [Labedaea sp.]